MLMNGFLFRMRTARSGDSILRYRRVHALTLKEEGVQKIDIDRISCPITPCRFAFKPRIYHRMNRAREY